MKNIIPICCFLLMSATVIGQDMLGHKPSNYAGLQGLSLNPASMANSRLKVDINLISLGITAENDFMFVPKDSLKFLGFGNIVERFDDSDYLDEFSFNDPNDLYNLNIAFTIGGPGVMFVLDNKHHLAFSTAARFGVSTNDVQGHAGKYAVEGLGYNPLHANNFLGKDFELNIMGWFEYDFSYATELHRTEKNTLAGGITLKWLRGVGGAYARDVNIHYNVLNESEFGEQDTMAFALLGSSSINYGRTDYSSFDNISGYDDMINGGGFGFDIGFTYDFLHDPSVWQYEMDGKKHPNPEINHYKFRMGLSLLDVGKINYRDNSNTYHLETDDPAYYLNWSTDEFATNTDLDTSFSNIFYGSPGASLREDNFDMALPTALNFQFDWNIKKRFYVNASYIHGFRHDKPGLDRPSVIALTPRYESPIFEASIPMSYLDYTGKIARIGIALRFASFFVGSDRLGSLFGLTDLYGMDFYTGLKFSLIKEKIPDADGDKVSDKKDKCPDVAGLLKFEGCPDRDGDDVPDATDQCPDIKGVPALAGCPDRDNDGIVDSKDECPDTPGVPQFNGCPDTDNDGLRDSEDDCPTIAGLIIYKGCPDTDGDSIPDPKDDCPTAKGLPLYNGCPDSDNDGLPDPKDECPYDVGPVSNKGCPVKILQAPTPKAPTQVQLTPEEQEIINKVFSNLQFEIGKAIIKAGSYSSLDDLAELMKRKPSFKLKIDGHTDNTGSAALNKSLSLKRAQAAKTYLVNKGVEVERITAKGYGKDKPVATNSTTDGRAKNRRVEFLIVE